MRKKLLPVLLTLALAVALLTVGALAATEEPGPVAQITDENGVTQYDTIDGAIEAADDGDTIELLANCAATETFYKSLTFTGDYTLSMSVYGWRYNGELVFDGADFTIVTDSNSPVANNGEAGRWFTMVLGGSITAKNYSNVTFEFDSDTGTNCALYTGPGGVTINVDNYSTFKVYGHNTSGVTGQGIQLDSTANTGIFVTDHSEFLIDGTNRGYVNSPTIYVEDSTFTVQNCTSNASNGGNFTAINSTIEFLDNVGHGLSTDNLYLTNTDLTADGNGYRGISINGGTFSVDSESKVYVYENSWGGDYAGLKLTKGSNGTVNADAIVDIRDNYCSGLSNNGTLTFQEGVDLTITNNYNDKTSNARGGGVYNSGGTLTLPSDAVIYNNHATTGGDDIYSTGTITFGNVGSAWMLDGDEVTNDNRTYPTIDDCSHLIDGWYDDSADARWEAHADTEDAYHVQEHEVSDGAVTGTLALKAAHGLLDADVDTVTITPADIIVYTGGDSYEGSINDEEQIEAGNGLPTPGYFITLPDWVDEKYFEGSGTAADLTGRVRFVLDSGDKGLTTDDAGDRIWNLDWYTDESIGSSISIGGVQRFVYRMDADSLHNIPVRIQFTDEEGNTVISDDFTINLNDLYKTYGMTIYPGELNRESIKAQILDDDGTVLETLDVKVSEDATLTIRGTTNAEIITGVGSGESDVAANTDVVNNDGGGAVTAIAPSGTEYYINESLVAVDPENVSLITDAVVETEPLRDYIVENDLAGRGENYVYRYLDLVDDTNGRAWVTATEDIEVYWSLPEGSSPTDNFRVIHFQGLDRQYDDLDAALAGNDPVIYSSADNNLSVVEIDGEYYLRFAVDTFSPFVLVWDTDGGDEPVIPPVRPTDPVRPQEPDGLNTEDHVAYIIGYPDGEVKPEGNITRAEVATIFFRLLTDETREEYWSQTNGYTDVARDAWYNNAISTLSNLGIIDGYEDGSFRPNSPITRAEFTKIAVSFFEYADIEYEGTFSDVAEGRWYTQFVAAAVEMGLIEGYPDGTFRPDASITRAEACTIVNRTLGRAPHEDHLLPEEEMITWPDNLYGAWYYADMQEATNSHDYEWTTEDSERVEDWTEKLPERDWDALEEIWSEANDAPGGEVIG